MSLPYRLVRSLYSRVQKCRWRRYPRAKARAHLKKINDLKKLSIKTVSIFTRYPRLQTIQVNTPWPKNDVRLLINSYLILAPPPSPSSYEVYTFLPFQATPSSPTPPIVSYQIYIFFLFRSRVPRSVYFSFIRPRFFFCTEIRKTPVLYSISYW